MKLPTHLDPAIKALFGSEQKPDEVEYYRQLQSRNSTIDRRWVSEKGFDAQQEFLFRRDISKRRRKL